MLRALRTWLTGHRRLDYLLAEAALRDAKAAHNDAFARNDSRAKHLTARRLREARTAMLWAEIALSKSRSRRSRSERGTHEMAGGFR